MLLSYVKRQRHTKRVHWTILLLFLRVGEQFWTQKLADSLKLAGSPFQGILQGSQHRCVWEPARIAVSEAPLRLTDQNLHFKQDFQGTARSRTHQSFQRDNL